MNLLQRLLLGPGLLPEELRPALVAEGVVVMDEGLTGSMTRRNYRAPRVRESFSKRVVAGGVAVTALRLLVWTAGTKQVDVPLAHPLRAAVEVRAEEPGRLLVVIDVARFHADRSGRVEIRLRTDHAAQIVAAARPQADTG